MTSVVCLFDIDGTLIESGGAGRAALVAALRDEFGMPLRSELDRMRTTLAERKSVDRAKGILMEKFKSV